MAARTATASEAPSPVVMNGRSHAATPIPPPVKVGEAKTTQQSGSASKDITVRLQYLENDPLYDTTKPVQVTPPFPRSDQTNVHLKPGPDETLYDVRGRQSSFTLDDNGFCYVHAPTKFNKWSSQPAIAKEFLPEMEELLKREIEGCDEIIFYDARIRQESDEGVRMQGLSFNPYARQVHVDNTERSVIEKIRSITEMKADYHLSGRARIINIWRPIKHPVYDCGLAVADGGKLNKDDVLECDRIRQDTGQYWDTMGVIKYRPGFHWHYMSLQDEPDVLLFKNYDSAVDVPARYCLHTAFDIPPEEVPANTPTRESIEVRALIFTHPKGARKPTWTATPHPLALTLEQNNLKLMDEEHSITDRLRTDIDEGNEVKDAVLLLRRQEIRRLESVREALTLERDELKRDLEKSRSDLKESHQQIVAQSIREQSLEKQNADLAKAQNAALTEKKELGQQRDQYQLTLWKALEQIDIQATHEQSLKDKISKLGLEDSTDVMMLQRHIQNQDLHIQGLKGEAMRIGCANVSMNWQGSVDEAVRREREKDAHLIAALNGELAQLRAVAAFSRK